MKFGFESEKILYDTNEQVIFHGVFRLIDALSDLTSFHGQSITNRVTNEFVIHMVEINTIASSSPKKVIEDYLLLHQLVSSISQRESVSLLPIAAIPFSYTPNMIPKWQYYVQNSILSGSRQKEWKITAESPMLDAANCAGLHAHFEVKCPKEFLIFSDELVNKHNMGLMLTPMVAFSSSPYFFGKHHGHSSRAMKYFYGIYDKFSLNGGLPPVFASSEDVIKYTLDGANSWIDAGVKVGFSKEDMHNLTATNSANWSMIRWNRKWNTIELRCLESDRIDYDISKFLWVASCMKRLDSAGESMKTCPIKTKAKLDLKMIDDSFSVSGDKVLILPTEAIHELTKKAVLFGLENDLVENYLSRLAKFSKQNLDNKLIETFNILEKVLHSKMTTSNFILKKFKNRHEINSLECNDIINILINQEKEALENLKNLYPDTIVKDTKELFPIF